ncbi:MAG: SH3 domain-containing protein [Chloroflexota bacterium]
MRLAISFVLLLTTLVMIVPAQGLDPACDGILTPQLVPGERGIVAPEGANNVRDAASAGGELVGQLAEGETFDVIDGPRCADGFAWFEVEGETVSGWSAEGGDDYWLLPLPPVAFTAADLTSPELVSTIDCGTEADAPVGSMTFSEDGTRIALTCGSGDVPMVIADIETGEKSVVRDGGFAEEGDFEFDGVREFGFVDNDTKLFIEFAYHYGVYDATDLSLIQLMAQVEFDNPDDDVTRLTPNGRFLLHTDQDPSTLVVRDPATLEIIQMIENPGIDSIFTIWFGNEGSRTILVATSDERGRAADTLIFRLDGDGLYQRKAAVPFYFTSSSPDGTLFARGVCTQQAVPGECGGPQIILHDGATYEGILRITEIQGFEPAPSIWLPDSTAFLTTDTRIYAYDLQGRALPVGEALNVVQIGDVATAFDHGLIAIKRFGADVVEIYRLGDN